MDFIDIHPDFLYYLKYKDQELINTYIGLREFILSLYPESIEILYHTHALTSVYSTSEKLGDAFCMIPIYTNHLNLGFNKGTILTNNNNLLKGTGKLIRHIPINRPEDYNNKKVSTLIKEAIELSQKDRKSHPKTTSITISKIKL